MDERSGAWREVERQSSFRQSSDRRSTAAEGSLKLAASSPPILGLDISLPMSFSARFCQKLIALLILSQSHQSFYSSASRQIHGLVKFTVSSNSRSRQIHKRGSGAREFVSQIGKRGFDVASEIEEIRQVLLFDGNS